MEILIALSYLDKLGWSKFIRDILWNIKVDLCNKRTKSKEFTFKI